MTHKLSNNRKHSAGRVAVQAAPKSPVATFTLRQHLKCIYCGESQGHPAKDVIPFVPNFFGPLRKEYQTGVNDCQCNACDQTFYVRKVDDMVAAANLPVHLYNYAK